MLTPLTVGAAAFVWRDRYRHLRSRIHYSLVVLAAVAFVWWLHYWNLLGFHF